MAIEENLTQAFSDSFAKFELKPEKLETRIGGNQWNVNDKSKSSIVLFLEHPLINTDQKAAEDIVLKALRSMKELSPYIETESETDHMKRLSNDLTWLRAQESAFNEKLTGERVTHIPENYPKWFEELPKRDDWNLKHALTVTRDDDGYLRIEISVPSDADADLIKKNFEARKAEILESLAKRTSKYSSRTDKEALEAEVKALNVDISTESQDQSKKVIIKIMSQERFNDMNDPKIGFKPEKKETYARQNPLMTLQNGDDDKDQDPSKPQPHLKKALARAFLTSGSSYIDVFPLIAGKEDMQREVGKSLTKLKKKVEANPGLADPELIKKIDEFLKDPVFLSHAHWGTPVEKRPDMPESVRFNKPTGNKNEAYYPNLMEVTIDLPADKTPKILQDLVALALPQPANDGVVQQASASAKDVADPRMQIAGQAAGGMPSTDIGAAMPAVDNKPMMERLKQNEPSAGMAAGK